MFSCHSLSVSQYCGHKGYGQKRRSTKRTIGYCVRLGHLLFAGWSTPHECVRSILRHSGPSHKRNRGGSGQRSTDAFTPGYGVALAISFLTRRTRSVVGQTVRFEHRLHVTVTDSDRAALGAADHGTFGTPAKLCSLRLRYSALAVQRAASARRDACATHVASTPRNVEHCSDRTSSPMQARAAPRRFNETYSASSPGFLLHEGRGNQGEAGRKRRVVV